MTAQGRRRVRERFTQALRERGIDPRGDVVRRSGRVDDRPASGLLCREREEPVANTAVEREIEVGLEAGLLAALPCQAHLGGQVEQQRQVGPEPSSWRSGSDPRWRPGPP